MFFFFNDAIAERNQTFMRIRRNLSAAENKTYYNLCYNFLLLTDNDLPSDVIEIDHSI